MARKVELPNSVIVNLRLDEDLNNILKDIAAIESNHTGKFITVSELIRNALRFVYFDNERLRECFRRARVRATTKLLNKKFAKFKKKK